MWLIAFAFGVLGSFHCVGMCSPIALMLPLGKGGIIEKSYRLGLYFLGKTLSYLSLGAVFALLGKGLFIAEYQQVFSVVVGVGILLVVIFGGIINRWIYSYGFSPWMRFIGQIKRQMAKEFGQNRSMSVLLIGFFNGFLPCGLVYMALFSALSQVGVNILLYMLCFSLGTIPLMLLVIGLGNFLGVSFRNAIQRWLPVFLVLIAILFIIRGLGVGVPYISPSTTSLMLQPNADCVVPQTP